jgi:hypothetical protein
MTTIGMPRPLQLILYEWNNSRLLPQAQSDSPQISICTAAEYSPTCSVLDTNAPTLRLSVRTWSTCQTGHQTCHFAFNIGKAYQTNRHHDLQPPKPGRTGLQTIVLATAICGWEFKSLAWFGWSLFSKGQR